MPSKRCYRRLDFALARRNPGLQLGVDKLLNGVVRGLAEEAGRFDLRRVEAQRLPQDEVGRAHGSHDFGATDARVRRLPPYERRLVARAVEELQSRLSAAARYNRVILSHGNAGSKCVPDDLLSSFFWLRPWGHDLAGSGGITFAQEVQPGGQPRLRAVAPQLTRGSHHLVVLPEGELCVYLSSHWCLGVASDLLQLCFRRALVLTRRRPALVEHGEVARHRLLRLTGSAIGSGELSRNVAHLLAAPILQSRLDQQAAAPGLLQSFPRFGVELLRLVALAQTIGSLEALPAVFDQARTLVTAGLLCRARAHRTVDGAGLGRRS